MIENVNSLSFSYIWKGGKISVLFFCKDKKRITIVKRGNVFIFPPPRSWHNRWQRYWLWFSFAYCQYLPLWRFVYRSLSEWTWVPRWATRCMHSTFYRPFLCNVNEVMAMRLEKKRLGLLPIYGAMTFPYMVCCMWIFFSIIVWIDNKNGPFSIKFFSLHCA